MSNLAPTKTELVDLLWRSTWTFIAAATSGATVSSFSNIDIEALDLLVISGGSAVVTLVKAFASNKLGTGTASSGTAPAGLPAPVASNNATPA